MVVWEDAMKTRAITFVLVLAILSASKLNMKVILYFQLILFQIEL